jgi:GTP cyclohydrolase IB
MTTTMTATTMEALPDIQAMPDARGVGIDRVGVTGVRYPLWVQDRERERQRTIATLGMFVGLPPEERGTHMSRFLEVLNQYEEMSVASVRTVAEHLRVRLAAEVARIEMEFPFFRRREAPVTGAAGLMEFVCGMEATVGPRAATDLVMRVRVPVATLCPCSREISERGAHNQRGMVDVRVRVDGFLWFEDLIDTVEDSASCALYPVLKRQDEKYVTERAYDNPRFVEDLLREIAVELRADPRVTWYRIEVENQESIHAHNAFASLERWK